jgi:hypothetical protein
MKIIIIGLIFAIIAIIGIVLAFNYNKKVDCVLEKDITNSTLQTIKYKIKTYPNSKGKQCKDIALSLDPSYSYITDNLGNIVGTKSQNNTPVNCELNYGNWGNCSKTCGGGTQSRTNTIKTQPSNGGTACPTTDQLTERQSCNTQPCPPVNCELNYGNWGNCSATCGGGTQSRTNTIRTPASNGGTACPSADQLTERQPCNTQPCPPVNCQLSESPTYGILSCNPYSRTKRISYYVTISPNETGKTCSQVATEMGLDNNYSKIVSCEPVSIF